MLRDYHNTITVPLEMLQDDKRYRRLCERVEAHHKAVRERLIETIAHAVQSKPDMPTDNTE